MTTKEKATAAFASLGVDPVKALELLTGMGLTLIDSKALETVLDQLGDRSSCSGCSRAIWWIVMRSGKKWPITNEGASHHIDCPYSKDFRRPKK